MVGVLVTCANDGGRTQLQSLAETVGSTRQNIAQVGAVLVRTGLLEGHRRRGGGMRLAKRPHQITLREVFEVAEYSGRLDPDAEDGRESLALSTTLAEARERYLGRLRETTIADLIDGTQGNAARRPPEGGMR